jgi:hypothetical protein
MELDDYVFNEFLTRYLGAPCICVDAGEHIHALLKRV